VKGGVWDTRKEGDFLRSCQAGGMYYKISVWLNGGAVGERRKTSGGGEVFISPKAERGIALFRMLSVHVVWLGGRIFVDREKDTKWRKRIDEMKSAKPTNCDEEQELRNVREAGVDGDFKAPRTGDHTGPVLQKPQ